MKKLLQRVLATVILSVTLTGQAFASAPEERILIESTKAGNWQQFLQNLSKVEMGDVKGYDPETDTVYTAAVLVWVCQNQASAWKQACANKPERFTAFKARNGWDDTITGADLRALGQGKGIFFPFATPTATPVATVTPEQLKALETTFATAQSALMAKVAENAQAVTSIRQQLLAKEAEVASLRAELKKAPNVESMTALRVEIAAVNSARKTLERELRSQISAVEVAAGDAATKAAAPAASQAAAALAATGKLDTRITEAGTATTTAITAVGGRVSTVETDLKKVNTSFVQRFGNIVIAFIGLALLLLAYAGYRLSRRLSTVKVEAVQAAEVKATAEVRKQVIEVVAPLQGLVGKLGHQVEEVKAALGDKYKAFSFDKEELTDDIERLKVGGVITLDFNVEGDHRQHKVTVVRMSATQCQLRGIPKQQEGDGVNIDNVAGRIMRAYTKNELATQQIAVVSQDAQLVDQLPTLRQEVSAA